MVLATKKHGQVLHILDDQRRARIADASPAKAIPAESSPVKERIEMIPKTQSKQQAVDEIVEPQLPEKAKPADEAVGLDDIDF